MSHPMSEKARGLVNEERADALVQKLQAGTPLSLSDRMAALWFIRLVYPSEITDADIADNDKRFGAGAERSIEEIRAADAFVKTMLERADAYHGPYPLWHGWAITDGFFAGISYAARTALKPKKD